ncbi:MAG: fimbrillin family protein [Phocaeicola sp.]
MKLTNWLSSAFVVAATLSSCSNETENLAQATRGTVQLTSTLNNGGFSRVADQWAGTEKVGMFMVAGAELTAVNDVENKSYNVAQGGALSATNGVEAKYPTDGTKVGFISYYPYSEAVASGIYSVDLSSEGDNDLLYATTAINYDQTTQGAVNLQYSHQLTRLVLDVKYNGETATDVSAVIARNTTATFDLATATFDNEATPAALAMEASVVAGRVTSLILPGEEAASKVTFTIDGKSFTWSLGTIDFEAGKQYRYTINLAATAAPAVSANLDSTITGWDTEEGADQDLEEDETPSLEVTYAQPTFVGALQAGVETSGAKLLLNYTSNLAEEVVVLVGVNGVGGVQAIVDGFQTLVAGQGTIEVPVTGTPLEAGDVTFVVSVEGEDVGTVIVPVAAAEEEGDGEGEGDAPVYTSNIDLAANGTSTQYYAHKVTINGATEEYNCVKLGSGSAVGLWTTNPLGSIAVGATKLKMYGAGWNGKKSTLSITVNNGGSIANYEGPYELLSNAGVSSNSPYKLVDFSDDYLFELEIKDFTAETTLTIETPSGQAAVFFGINIE